ncbi:MAG: hypothetical protein HY067_16190 [Betaproteobacteria bacterium]|nr:hypothetical protein [Betaproteobacteria bacterium]
MKRLLWQNAVIGGVFLIFTISTNVAFYYFLPRPLIQNQRGDITAQIETINDIEHLRKIALLQVKIDIAKNRMFNDLIYKGVDAFVALGVFGTIMFFVNFMSLLKLKKQESGAKPSWLKWF